MTDRFQKTLAQKLATPAQTVTAKIQESERLLAAKPKFFLVTYRISKRDVPAKGDYDKRRNALIERIRALAGTEFHLSTSAWRVTSRRDSTTLLSLLSAPLEVTVDFLSVTQVGPTRTFGDAALED